MLKGVVSKIRAWLKPHLLFLLLFIVLLLVKESILVFNLLSSRDLPDIPESVRGGNFAFDLLNDSFRGMNYYQYNKLGHLGSTIFVGVFALPFFIIFGTSLFSLYQVPIFFSLATLFVLYVLSNQFLDKKIALISCTLYVFSPFEFHAWTSYPYFFAESSFFSILILYMVMLSGFSKNTFAKESFRSILLYFSTGLISGLAIFHTEAFLLTLFALGLIYVLWRKRFTGLFPLIFIFGLSLGLIPYFLFGGIENLYNVVSHLLTSNRFGVSYANPNETSTFYSSTLFSLAFWPFRIIELNGFEFGLGIYLFPMITYFILSKKRSTPQFKAITFFLFTIVTLMMIAFLKAQSKSLYYVYLIYANCILLSAIALSTFEIKLGVKPLQYLLRFYLTIICVNNLLPLFSNIDLSTIQTQIERFTTARGYAFYWPGEYRAYNGNKTAVGALTEYIAIHKKTGPKEDLNTYPKKTLFLNKNYDVAHALKHRADYLMYGVDVSYYGLKRSSHNILTQLDSDFHRIAFAGLSVFWANDTLLCDLIEVAQRGDLRKFIPYRYQVYFYQEIGRRLWDYERKKRSIAYKEKRFEEVAKHYEGFNSKEKIWIIEGAKLTKVLNASTISYHRRFRTPLENVIQDLNITQSNAYLDLILDISKDKRSYFE